MKRFVVCVALLSIIEGCAANQEENPLPPEQIEVSAKPKASKPKPLKTQQSGMPIR